MIDTVWNLAVTMNKTSLLSLRVDPPTRKAVEAAAARDRRSVSNFIEGAVLSALPADLRTALEEEKAALTQKLPVQAEGRP